MSGDLFKPKNPTREDILDTINADTVGMSLWRNPVRLETVHKDWPRHNRDSWYSWGQDRNKRINGMESDKLHRNGSLK